MLTIDGSHGEGGGQIIRTACTFSAITGQPVHLVNIRAKRENPGLRAQHLAAVKAAGEICGAEIRGAEVGSVQLFFTPGRAVEPGDYRFDIGTAGSTTLVLQTVFPALALAGGESMVTVTGGTHNPMAPTADYLMRVFEPMARRMGWPVSISYGPAGFYPKGGGCLSAQIGVAVPKAFSMGDCGDGLVSTSVMTANLPSHVAQRGAATFSSVLGCETEIRRMESPGVGAVASLFVEGEIPAGFTALGEKGKTMESVVFEAVGQFKKWCGTGFDEHLADQLVPLLALTPGESCFKASLVTDHLRTVLEVVRWFGAPVGEVCEETGTVRVGGMSELVK